MKKREFLRKLAKKLDNMKKKEVEDIIDYYDELIEDTIERTGKSEEDVIFDLGPIDDIVRKVTRVDSGEKIRFDEDELSESAPQPRVNRKDNSGRTLLVILILILLFPLWVAAFATMFSLIVAAIATGISIFISGVHTIIVGIVNLSTATTNSIFSIGFGFILMGIALIIAPLLMKIVSVIYHLFIRFFKWLFKIASGKGKVYEN